MEYLKNKYNKILSKYMNSSEFIKYLKKLNFPSKNYNAIESYPNTEIINGYYINDFNKKYKKKYLYDHEDKNILNNSIANQLFNNSFKYLSDIQANLFNKNIDNYISGGSALKMYALKNKSIISNLDIFMTKDVDLYLYYKEKIMNNTLIINNIFKIIDSVLYSITNPNYAFLELYILINYEDTKKFTELIKIMMNNSFELFLYKNNEENNIYQFKFLKVINNEFCIRIKIKFLKIDRFLIENIYSYIKLTYYYIKKISNSNFKVLNKYIPIEILVKNKNNSNLDLMKSNLELYQNYFYIYNEETLLYNLMHLYYKYKVNTGDITIDIKKESGKNIRDEKRLDIFFKIYCNNKYKNLDNININKKLQKLKKSYKKFKKIIEDINNFEIIENIMQ